MELSRMNVFHKYKINVFHHVTQDTVHSDKNPINAHHTSKG